MAMCWLAERFDKLNLNFTLLLSFFHRYGCCATSSVDLLVLPGTRDEYHSIKQQSTG